MTNKSGPAGACVKVLPPAALAAPARAAWDGFVAAHPLLGSPLFSLAYAETLARVVPEVRVAVLEQDGRPAAFLPFELNPQGLGTRLHLCDFQGLIAPPDFAGDVRALVRGAGLRAWDFDHLLAGQDCLAAFHHRLADSPVINISAGYEAYVAERRAAGTEYIKKCGNLSRRMERELGPLRFEPHVADPALLHQLLRWRADKYQDGRHPFALLEGILREFLTLESPGCSGALSVLYAGEKVIACHFGLRSARRWHYWFPAYNPEFEKYSGGTILLLKIAELCPSLGITEIDLGKGEQDYKRRLMNGSVPLAEGAVEVSSLLSLRRSLRRQASALLRKSPFLARLAGRGPRPESAPAPAAAAPASAPAST